MTELASLEISEARQRLERVKSGVERIWDDLVALYQGRAWIVLGYASWESLCDAELDGARIALPRQQRQEVVCDLRGAGMSTRAIASAVGVHHSTVADDLATVGNPTVDVVTGLDGRTRTATPVRPTAPPEPIEPWDPTEGIPAEELAVFAQAVQMSPLIEVINQLDEIARDAERHHLPHIVDEDGAPVPLFDSHKKQLQQAADRLRLAADHITAYLGSTL